MSSSLLEPFDLRGLHLPNRVVMAPMTRSRAISGAADAMTEQYYTQRASAGLIVTEGSPISREGTGYVGTPGIWADDQVDGWRRVTDAVRDRGGRMFVQLWHVGRASHVSLQPDGRAPVSSVEKDGDTLHAYRTDGTFGRVASSMPRALTTAEIPRLVDDFATATDNAVRAGFHGVEIHGATRYLFEQFLNSAFNDRSDRYGTRTVTDRLRFVLDVVDAAIDRLDAGRVGIRLSPFSTVGNMPVDEHADETYRALIQELSDRELAYISLHDTSYIDPTLGRRVQTFLREIRGHTGSTPFMLAGGLTPRTAADLIDDGVIDLAAFGRAYIGNPDLVERLGTQAALTEADPETFYEGGAAGYTDYPPADAQTLDTADYAPSDEPAR
ncbi:alkene reductase [Rhodococcus sp. 06-156-3C]|uniref:alkene reductase n=1 Tax=Nocardiaceae TaxID=85025 RepID=UPI000690EB13|nr:MULTISPECIES: alkene reductase [Rhodococcus]OZD12568.1 alkene reductase [Rhodococcus sp. 06-156-4a]OZD18023.1 alkene reductase [Rhodococcus sp. 06-156-3C]OZD20417.1 alkene reductase [Rhodococcus sp. 06-156-4C]OZD29261.1 alkene reductase [Rhodococcus sp. 06-156-3]OZD30533.1 alkene reductase [Rhodococcus sp. 06-156-3b]